MQDNLFSALGKFLPTKQGENQNSTIESETMSDAFHAYLFSFAAFSFFPLREIVVQSYESFDGQIHGAETLLKWSAIVLLTGFLLFCCIRLVRAIAPTLRKTGVVYGIVSPAEFFSLVLPVLPAALYSIYLCTVPEAIAKDVHIWQYMSVLYALPLLSLTSTRLARRPGMLNVILAGFCNGLCGATALTLMITSLIVPGTQPFFETLHQMSDQLAVLIILVLVGATFSFVPLLAFFASFSNWRTRGVVSPRGRFSIIGFVAGLAVVISPMVSPTLTHMVLEDSVHANEVKQRAMVRFLRIFGDKDELLSHCYGYWYVDEHPQCRKNDALKLCLNWIFQRDDRDYVEVEWARTLYYRVIGRPFNASSNKTTWNVHSYDSDVAGTSVGGKVAGLALADSMLRGELCAEDQVATYEWTFVLENPTQDSQEARAQISLPPGGVVSNAILWVDGKPRQALVCDRFAARQAYQQVVYGQRDPLLISDVGNDKVLMQCYPVLPGKKMKVQVDITLPVRTDRRGHALASLPILTEANFDLPKQQKVDMSLDYIWSLKLGNQPESETPIATSTMNRLFASVPTTSLENHFPYLITQRVFASQVAPRTNVASRNKNLVVVIDGAVGIQPHLSQIVRALEKIPGETNTTFLIASDEISSIAPAGTSRGMILEALREAPFLGGPSNLAALSEAIDSVDDGPDGSVLWIHGPQPDLYGEEREVFRKLLCDQATVSLYDFEVVGGPNKITEVVGRPDLLFPGNRNESSPSRMQTPVVFRVPRQLSVAEDLQSFLSSWAQDDVALFSPPLCRHLGCDAGWQKLKASRDVKKAIETGLLTNASQLACQHGIVTPTTSALVLETDQQYKDFGLLDSDRLEPGKVLRMDGIAGYSRSGGLVGAPVDPRFGQSNEVGMLADYGYDTARDVVRVATFLSLVVSLLWGLRVSYAPAPSQITLGRLFKAAAIVYGLPTAVHFVGIFMINNFGCISGGL
jgi:hypothetical protein